MPRRHERAWVALAILGLLVTIATLGWLSMLNAAMLAAGLMIMMGGCSATIAHRSVDGQVLLVIAAAALMFPIAVTTAASLGVHPLPFAIVVMLAASYGFATPIGYQTNLMVYGPGGYRFADYLRIGIPLDLIMGVMAVLVTPLVWPF